MREYILKSPGRAGGLVPAPGDGVIVPFPASALPPSAAPPSAAPASALPASAAPASARAAFSPGLAPALCALPSAPGLPLPPPAAKQRLSKKETTPLAIAASRAWRACLASDPSYLPDLTELGYKKGAVETEWRHSQCKLATAGHPAGQITGLTSATREHYNTLLAHFAGLAGEDVASFRATMRSGPAKYRAGADGDSQEDIRQALAVVKSTMTSTGYGWPYVATTIKGKYQATTLEQLTRQQLWQLVYTLRNRANARDGKGDPANRNKRQKAKA